MITYKITKRNLKGQTTLDEGSCETYEDALEIYIDCVIDHGKDDSWIDEDYSRIKLGKNNIKYRKLLQCLNRDQYTSEEFLSPTDGMPYMLELSVTGQEEDDDEYELFSEGLDPKYADQPENQYGEKWERLSGTYLNSVIESIMKDIRVDSSDEDGPRMERMSLGDLHICEDGHLIAEIYGGANGGGFRGVESNWPFYLALVKKFLLKLLDYDNGNMFKDVWMIDWDNDCCDDVWTLTLGIRLSDKEKLHLVEGNKFPVVDPTQLDVSLDAAVEMVNPLANDAIEVANAAATVAESRKRK